MNDSQSLFGDMLRGNTDKIILSILLKADSYGYKINKILEDETQQRFSLNEATLYTTFKRLEMEGYITSYWQENQMNQKRKYYSITSQGKEYLIQSKKDWIEATKIINYFIDEF